MPVAADKTAPIGLDSSATLREILRHAPCENATRVQQSDCCRIGVAHTTPASVVSLGAVHGRDERALDPAPELVLGYPSQLVQ